MRLPLLFSGLRVKLRQGGIVLRFAGCACLLSVAFAAPALAENARAKPAYPEEIVVTGERSQRSVKDTPSSVAVFRASDIDVLAAPNRLDQLLELVPNVQLGSGSEAPAIRGHDGTGVLQALPGFLGGARPRTTLQVDGRAIDYNEFAFGIAPLWDVDRVEVFRSPQSSTQGRNSIAGAIFIESARPTYDFENRFRAIWGDARTRQLSGAVSGPIVADQLAVRVTGDLRRGRASTRLSGPVEGVSLNREGSDVVRARFLAEPRAVPGLKVLLTYSHVGSAMPQVASVRPPFKARRNPAYLFGYFKIDVDSVTAAITTPVTGALESRTTLSWGDASIRRFAPRSFGETRIHGRDRSVETVLDWRPGGRISAIAGLHLLANDLDQQIDLAAALLGKGEFRDEQRSGGLFGELSWHATDRLTVTAGMRYQVDGKDRSGVLHTRLSDIPLDYQKTFHALLPKVSVAFDIRPQIKVGAMVQRAYNPGGVALNLRFRREDRFAAERLWNYEIFARGTLLGGRLSVASNLFYNAIEDAQRSQDFFIDTPGGQVGISDIANQPRARSYGAELELGYKYGERLSVRAGIGLLDTRITRTLFRQDPALGKRFARSPAVSAAVGIDWRPLAKLGLSSQLRHNSGYFSDDAETPDLRIAGSTTVDARASWRIGRFGLFAYARNLFDEFHLTSRGAAGFATANDPRQVGLGVEARY